MYPNNCLSFHIKEFQYLTPDELYEILKARFTVFVMEQKCFYLDMDDIDYYSYHITLWHDKNVIAYARLYRGNTPGVFHVGRLLTTVRHKGYGRSILQTCLSQAKRCGAKRVVIDAQTHAISFYEKIGFEVISEEFMEAGIPHKKMQFDLTDYI